MVGPDTLFLTDSSSKMAIPVSERLRARREAIQARRDALDRARDLHLQDLQMEHLDEGELFQERFVRSTRLLPHSNDVYCSGIASIPSIKLSTLSEYLSSPPSPSSSPSTSFPGPISYTQSSPFLYPYPSIPTIPRPHFLYLRIKR